MHSVNRYLYMSLFCNNNFRLFILLYDYRNWRNIGLTLKTQSCWLYHHLIKTATSDLTIFRCSLLHVNKKHVIKPIIVDAKIKRATRLLCSIRVFVKNLQECWVPVSKVERDTTLNYRNNLEIRLNKNEFIRVRKQLEDQHT